MHRLIIAFGVVALSAPIAGCGGDDDFDRHIVDITSNQPADGSVAFDPVTEELTVESAADVQVVTYGIDDSDPDAPEFRGFLDFSRKGIVPIDADVRLAVLEIFIGAVEFADTVPSLLELVDYPHSGPRAADFDGDALDSRTFDVFDSDVGDFIRLDVTDQYLTALDEGLSHTQFRLSLDPSATRGFVQIADHLEENAPLLRVKYLF